MTSNPATAPSTERSTAPSKAHAHKASSATTAQPGQFAALLLQADDALGPDLAPATAAITTTTTTTTATAATADTELPDSDLDDNPAVDNGLALLGWMDWRNLGQPVTAQPAQGGTPAPQAASTAPPPLTATNLQAEAVASPLLASAVAVPTTPAANGTAPQTPTQAGAGMASAVKLDPHGASTTPLPPVTVSTPAPEGGISPPAAPGAANPNPAAALAATNAVGNPVGAKLKVGAARHAPSGLTGLVMSTATGGAATPSTVSLAAKAGISDPSAAGALRSPAGKLSTEAPSANAPLPLDGLRSEAGTAPSFTDPTAPLPTDVPGAAGGPSGTDSATTMANAPADVPTPTSQDAMERTMERLSAQVSYWATQGNQRASLTIAGEHDQPIEVRVSFEKGEVSVHFETDEPSMRDALTTSAEDMLNRMLETKGMTLGNVSVGSGQADSRQPPQPQAHTPQAENRTTATGSANGATQAPPTTTAQRPRSIISHDKVDLFA